MPPESPDRSYRALFRVPSMARILAGMQIARIGQSMVSVAMVLFTLTTYHSAELAGVVTFVAIVPGMLVSPIAGALLDRHGRSRLVLVDYVVASLSLALIGGLALAGALPVWVLLLIAGVSSLTAPLSSTGLRSLFPLLVPVPLWERINAVDSMGYVVATIVGPPLAGVVVGLWGGPAALVAIALTYAVAAVVLIGIPDPRTDVASTGRLLVDAWQGLVYTWRNRTLRALGFSISAINLSGGVTTIVIPLIVLDRLHQGPATVGTVFAVLGVGGAVAALVFGRMNSAGRERRMLVLPMFANAAALLLLLPAQLAPMVASMTAGGPPQRADGHRVVHAPATPDGPRLDGPGLRRLDELQLRRIPHRIRHRGMARRPVDRGSRRVRCGCLPPRGRDRGSGHPRRRGAGHAGTGRQGEPRDRGVSLTVRVRPATPEAARRSRNDRGLPPRARSAASRRFSEIC